MANRIIMTRKKTIWIRYDLGQCVECNGIQILFEIAYAKFDIAGDEEDIDFLYFLLITFL